MAGSVVDMKARFGLEGDQKFRQGMKEAANAIKVLNSEQKLAKATFKQTGDAQKYAAQQAEILKKKIEEQKKAIKAAEDAIKTMTNNGIKENDRVMQQWQTKLNDARTSLTNMETELKQLTDTSQEAAQGTEQLGDSLEHLDKTASIQAVTNALNGMANTIGSAISKVKDLAVGLVGELREAASWADDLATQALMWNLSPEELQRMRMTADLIDTPVDAILNAQARFKRNIASDSKETRSIFQALGIYTDKYEYGVFEDSVDLFWQAGDAIMRLGNEFDREEYAQKIFGRSWHELIPLFKAGREEYEKTMAEQQVVTDENVGKLGELDDALQTLQNRFETMENTVLAEISPTLKELAEKLSGFLKELNDYLASEDGKAALQSLSDAIHGLFEDLLAIEPEDVFKGVQDGLNKVKEALEWIKNNKDDVVKAIKGVVIAWGSLKVSAAVGQLLQLINGLKGLTGSEGRTLKHVLEDAFSGTGSGKGGTPTGSGGAPTAKGTEGTSSNPGWFTSIVSKAAEADLAFKALPVVIGTAITTALAGYTSGMARERDYGDYNRVREAMTGTAADVEAFGQSVVDAQKAIDAAQASEGDRSEPLRQYIAGNEEAVRAAGDALNLWARVDEAAKTKGVEARQVIEDNLINIPYDQWLQTVTDYIAQMAQKKEEASDAGAQIPEGTAEGIEEGTSTATAAVDTMNSEVESTAQAAADSLAAAGESTGAALGDGMARGIDSKVGVVSAAAQRLAGAASKVVNQVLQVHSPSRVFAQIGAYVGMGFAEGIESQISTVQMAAQHMAGAAMIQPQSGVAGFGNAGRGMVDVTLMIGPEQLTEVLVPLVNDGIGQQLALERR